jgi:hypothetical protein
MVYKTFHRKPKIRNTYSTKYLEWTQVLQKGKLFLLHMWHMSYHSCNKPGDKSWMRKSPDCDYDKRKKSLKIPKGYQRSRKSNKDRQHNRQKNTGEKWQTKIYKTLSKKLRIEQNMGIVDRIYPIDMWVNISVVICDRYIPYQLTKLYGGDRKLSKWWLHLNHYKTLVQ